MPGPLFEFFEIIAEELSVSASRVITHEDLRMNDDESPLLDSLMKELKAPSPETAIPCAVKKLKEHFAARSGELPFEFQPEIGKFTATDPDFIAFVNAMKQIRSIGKRSSDFECTVATWLGKRTTGTIHRIGYPRSKKKAQKAFNRHLRGLGFQKRVLLGADKDGGLDILWLLPVGAIPHKPFISVQCKNGVFDEDEAHKSLGVASGSLAQHGRLQQQVHVPCVLFNDYISSAMLSPKPMAFVALGLSDLAPLKQRISVKHI